MKVLSLFSGIGGLDLGLERAGMTVVGQVEIDPWCRQVLAKHWPGVPRHDDVRTAARWWGGRPVPDLIAGGFPCQPVSSAGRRLAQDDPRWLWPAMAETIRRLRPRYALMENVPGLLARGMGDVLGDLAACGYDAEWDCVPAAAVGAPHRRDRVWIVAYPQRQQLRDESGRRDGPRRSGQAVPGNDGPARLVADAAGTGSPHGPAAEGWPPLAEPQRLGGDVANTDMPGAARFPAHGRPGTEAQARIWRRAAERGGPGRPGNDWWAAEPDVGRVAHGIPRRVDRLRGLGNAVVPQVAEHIGRLILAAA